MVLYENVVLNQQVEANLRGRVYSGVVKFKGCLNGVQGEWIGVELNERVGKHDGMIKGRRYFSCNAGHGIFVPAEKLRFSTKKRCLYNSYRSGERDPELWVEEPLFDTERPVSASPYDPTTISRNLYNAAKSGSSYSSGDAFKPERSFNLRHSVSNTLPAATMLTRPHTARPHTSSSMYTYRSAPLHREYGDEYDEWVSAPSIPPTHMPHSAMRDQVRRGGWEKQHYPRQWRVHTARESVKWDKWNDVSY